MPVSDFGLTRFGDSPIVRAGMNLHYTLQTSMKESIPTPRDQPHFRWHGAAHRVLLLGSGPTHGWGVFTHRYSLTGQLGVSLHETSGKPVNVDYVGEELMNIETAASWVQDVALEEYDVIIVMVGLNDALRMTPTVVWAKHMQVLLDDLRTRKAARASIVTVGIEPTANAVGYNPIVGAIAQQHADRLNDLMRNQLKGEQEHYLDISPRSADYSHGPVPSDTYLRWSQEIARVVSPLLPSAAPVKDISDEQIKFNWAGTARALGYDGKAAPKRLTEIEAAAKKKFGVYLAQINLMDGDRQWIINHTGPVPASVPRDLTFCAITTQQTEALIVPNANKDERFKDNAYLKQAHMPFYAGKTLFSIEGDPVATFCLFDIVPRPKAMLNQKEFDRLHQEAQEEIWRIEQEVTGKVVVTEQQVIAAQQQVVATQQRTLEVAKANVRENRKSLVRRLTWLGRWINAYAAHSDLVEDSEIVLLPF